MSTYKNLMTVCCAAVLALGLAACGGGGSDGPTSSGTGGGGGGGGGGSGTGMKTPLSYATDLNGDVDALMALAAADTEDGSALMMAMEAAAKIGTEASDGNSMAAMMNAQAVLDAKDALEMALGDAKAAKMAAEEAKAATEDADVIAALDIAISNAETEIEAAEMVLNGDDLAGYVDMVTGGEDADPMGTPASVAKGVAQAVAMALGPTSNTDGTGTRVTPLTAVPTDATTEVAALRDTTSGSENPVAKANKFTGDNHMGRTWAEIVGDGVMTVRISNVLTEVGSIAGMAAATTITTSPPTAAETISEGTSYADANYMGIPGSAVCLGKDCEVGADGTANAGKLLGSWYFSPTSTMAYYEKVGGATDYTAELYVNYGHWLVVDDGSTTAANEGQVTVFTYAALSGTSDNGAWAAADPTSTTAGLRASSAIYEGMAAGRSVHKTLDSQGAVTDIQSGRFTADVMLTATFAAAGSTLGGMIDNFQGDAVDPSWEVTLNAATTGDGSVATGVTEATGQDGDWTSDAYGDAADRPVGIFGSFNAHFTDGHAAGAYATRKQ